MPTHLSFALLLPACLAALVFVSGCTDTVQAQGGPQEPAPVSVAHVVQRTVAKVEDFSGRLEAAKFVELRARVSGVIEQLHFIDGALVKKGQLLFSIDPRPYAAEVARAQSLLIAAKARFELAGSELARAK